jgi:hypothetical protein
VGDTWTTQEIADKLRSEKQAVCMCLVAIRHRVLVPLRRSGKAKTLTRRPPMTAPTAIPAIAPLDNPLFPATAAEDGSVPVDVEVELALTGNVYPQTLKSTLAVSHQGLDSID